MFAKDKNERVKERKQKEAGKGRNKVTQLKKRRCLSFSRPTLN